MIKIDLNPNNKILKQFKWACLVAFPIISLIVIKIAKLVNNNYSKDSNLLIIGICSAIGVLIFLLGTINIRSIKYIYLGLIFLFYPLSIIIGNIVLLLLYTFLFLPFGIVFKLIGRDELRLKFNTNAQSHWIKCKEPRPAEAYYRQF